MAVGSFCLVLHGHLPYVLRHGTWPHGEDWLYEAAAETYLRLLSTLDECRFLNGNPRVTIGLTPILLEQLVHEDFKEGFQRYLADRVGRARSDRKDFQAAGQKHLEYLTRWWEEFYGGLAEQFESLDRDIPAAFAAHAEQGDIELLTAPATHAYLPLLLEDSSLHAQLRAGQYSSSRILGFSPQGLWLPEGAYRPDGFWHPPIEWGGAGLRHGLERLLADKGITHFFVEGGQVERSPCVWVRNGESPDGWMRVHDGGGPRPSIHEPVCLDGDDHGPNPTAVFGRDTWICKQVWSGICGYPANGVYMEFHKRYGRRRGLRYWKVTDTQLDLGGKDPYYPDDVQGRIHEHATHFCDQVRRRLHEYHDHTGRHGVLAACFDAELFGHWWFEGCRFLRDVMLNLNADPDIELCTASQYLERHPPDKAVHLAEGSWGEGGDHRVWTHETLGWMWETEYRCESEFGKLTYHLPWRDRPELRQILEKAGRELLLLQASDWPFVISRRQAADYGIKRFIQHVGRFERLTDVAQRLAEDPDCLGKLTRVERFELEDADVHDVVFPHVDLEWWST